MGTRKRDRRGRENVRQPHSVTVVRGGQPLPEPAPYCNPAQPSPPGQQYWGDAPGRRATCREPRLSTLVPSRGRLPPPCNHRSPRVGVSHTAGWCPGRVRGEHMTPHATQTDRLWHCHCTHVSPRWLRVQMRYSSHGEVYYNFLSIFCVQKCEFLSFGE